MPASKTIESWHKITGIGHGDTWAVSSSFSVPDGNEPIPSSTWSEKSSSGIDTPTKARAATSTSVLNAMAPAFVPGGHVSRASAS
jgi:hypothetical protein